MRSSTFSDRPSVALIKGDGIGPEITDATLHMLEFETMIVDAMAIKGGKANTKSFVDAAIKDME